MDRWQRIFGPSGSAHQFMALLAIAALCAGVGAIAIAVMLRQRNQRSAAYIAALERLNEVALGLVPAPGEITPQLDRLASAARELLGMPLSRICLYESDDTTLTCIHRVGFTSDYDDLHVFQSDRALEKFLREGRTIFVRAPRERSTRHWLNSDSLERHAIAGLIILPLVASKKSLGLMLLARPRDGIRSRDLNESQRRVAQLLAAHASATVANARLYRRMEDAIRSYRRLEAQRDTVYAVNTTLQRVESLEQALSRVAELAPTALEVDACVVCLADQPAQNSSQNADRNATRDLVDVMFLDDTLHVAAVTPLRHEFPLRVGMTRSNTIFARLMRRGRTVEIADADQEPLLRAEGLNSGHGIGAMLCLPLSFRGGRPIGALLLTRRTPGKFSDETIKLAEMYASRAAISIENMRLQDQARRDAETKATLLRELNHRVKNNLAGLIGLLSIGTPPLSSEAQHWLDRVIERIGALARAHELFTAGGEVRLSQMIDTTLDSIAAIKPDAVQIDVRIHGRDVVLSAAQTVPAALMFYELVYNAVVHGAGDAGKIEVQVHPLASGRVTIDVIDDGNAGGSAGGTAEATAEERSAQVPASNSVGATTQTRPRKTPAIHHGSGAGLTIVRGLVARELHGTFELRANAQGGTTATVAFPIEAPVSAAVGSTGATIGLSPGEAR